jgi:hypothetical protein
LVSRYHDEFSNAASGQHFGHNGTHTANTHNNGTFLPNLLVVFHNSLEKKFKIARLFKKKTIRLSAISLEYGFVSFTSALISPIFVRVGGAIDNGSCKK